MTYPPEVIQAGVVAMQALAATDTKSTPLTDVDYVNAILDACVTVPVPLDTEPVALTREDAPAGTRTAKKALAAGSPRRGAR